MKVYILENYTKNPYANPIRVNGKVIKENILGNNHLVKFEDGNTKLVNKRFLFEC